MSLLLVPTEVLFKILSCNCIEISDLFHVMCSCSELNQMIGDLNGLWRLKFTEKWPWIHFQEEDKRTASWLERIHSRIRLGKETKAVIQSMSPLCYPHGVKAFTPQCVVDRLMDLLKQNPLFVEDEISNLSFQSENLTTQHYARHLLKKVRTLVLEKKWIDFNARKWLDMNEQPESKQTMWMEGALLMSQWLNMEERELPRFEVLDGVFDEISQRVKTLVLDSQLTGNMHILSIISQVLFDEMCFSARLYTNEYPYPFQFDQIMQTYCIDKVLLATHQERRRECHVTILCFIYQEVARRMGIYCEPVFYVKDVSRHYEQRDVEILFLLRCRELSKNDDGEFTYINTRDSKGSLKRPDSSGHLGPYFENGETVYYTVETRDPAASVDWVFRGILNHLGGYVGDSPHECRTRYHDLKYTKLLNAFDYHEPFGRDVHVNQYMDIALHVKLELDDALNYLQVFHNESIDKERIANQFRQNLTKAQTEFNLPVLPKHRSPTQKYAVGHVVFYRTREVREGVIEGVIVSWVKPRSKAKQPWYQVLPCKSNCIPIKRIKQDELELFPDSASIHFDRADLGLHFEKFDGRRFVPNAEKKRHFPEDEAFALSLIGN